MKIVNLTPHEVNIVIGGNIHTFPKSEDPLRLGEDIEDAGEINDIPVVNKHFTAATLPDEEEDTRYIVSSLVALAFPSRHDLLVPDELIRDDDGRILGSRRFARIL